MFVGTKLTNVFDTSNIKGLFFTHIFDRIKSYLMSVYREKICGSVENLSQLANKKSWALFYILLKKLRKFM